MYIMPSPDIFRLLELLEIISDRKKEAHKRSFFIFPTQHITCGVS